MNQTVPPATGPLRGTIELPGDKSISHRAFLINALGQGSARIRGALDAEDVARSRALVRALGIDLVRTAEGWTLSADGLREPEDVIDCGNSGTTMRLGAAVCSHAPGLSVLTGDASLRGRPMERIAAPLSAMGISVRTRSGRAPLVVDGHATTRVQHELAIASAQVKSACLLAGRDVGVSVREPRVSRDHTERMLRAMGADLDLDLVLEPGSWSAVDVDVPGDLSSAAFWAAAAATVPGSRIELPGVGLNPTRSGVLDALLAMGATVQVEAREGTVEPQGTVRVAHAGLQGIRIEGELALRCLDELPILAVVAALADSETVICDAEELRYKESDRIHRVVTGLRALGADVDERPDGMVLAGGGFTRGGEIDASGDHRIAMAFAIAALSCPHPVRIAHADGVHTSYPAFFEHLEVLR